MLQWGINSVHGKIDASWAMIANTSYDSAGAPDNKLAPAEYWKLADRFQPRNYNPDRWMESAAAAGFRYAVFVALHHDGSTLWPSACSEFGVQSTPGGSDLLGPYIEACRRHGIKAGVYLSPPDWHFDRKCMSFNYGSMGGLTGEKREARAPQFDEHHRPAFIPPPTPEHIAARRALFHERIRQHLTLKAPSGRIQAQKESLPASNSAPTPRRAK